MYTDLVPADAARAHITQLIDEGGSNQSRIARAADIARPTVVRIHNGNLCRITRDTHERIMRVGADDDGVPAGHVDALGSRRRTRSLVADGHTCAYIAMRSQLTLKTIWNIIDGDLAYVPTEVAHRIERAFAVMQMTPGRSVAARTYGAAQRWHLPWEWDEEDIDRRRGRPFPSSFARRQEITAAIEVQHLLRFRPAVIPAPQRTRYRSAA